MEIIIIIIIIAVLISKSQKKAQAQAKEAQNNTKNQPPVRPQSVTRQTRTEKTAAQLKDEIWSRLSEESKAKMLYRDTYQQMAFDDSQKKSADKDMSAADQVNKRRMEERNTSILDRAKGNNIENAKDVTLATMEEEHNHSERVAPAIHHHPEDHLEESMLGKLEDLIATGYDGNLCFERDFLGEAMDMIGRFTVPSEIMDFRENK